MGLRLGCNDHCMGGARRQMCTPGYRPVTASDVWQKFGEGYRAMQRWRPSCNDQRACSVSSKVAT